MVSAEIWTIAQTREGSVVLLRPLDTNIAVPIFIGQLEIQSILIGKEGVILPRPLTHDLIINLLSSQKLNLDRVEIHDLKDSTFHARLVIRGGTYTAKNPLLLDSRPSDALGLATRCKCPIFVSPEIISETGIPTDFFIDTLDQGGESVRPQRKGKTKSPPPESKHNRLLRQLNDAVENEEYETAAKIRDMLKEMEKESP